MEMSSINGGTKRRVHLWEKSAFHFSLCFTIGFFTGFAPSHAPSSSFTHIISYQQTLQLSPAYPIQTPPPTPHLESMTTPTQPPPPPAADGELGAGSGSGRLLIIITTTRSGDPSQPALLGRLARTLRSVAPPLLWIVVEARSEALRTAGVLRRTGVVYRHLTFRESFTDPEAEAHHQRNVALGHIEHHRIHGIVHFAGAYSVYDLRFFEEIRGIEAFGAWPVALVSSNSRPVTVEGPVCSSSSQVVGWYVKDVTNGGVLYKRRATVNEGIAGGARPWRTISIWGFAFNSSVLWDPERWGRPTSVPDTSQDSMGFIQQVITEDETKVRAIPSDCSRVMLWHLRIPTWVTNHGRR